MLNLARNHDYGFAICNDKVLKLILEQVETGRLGIRPLAGKFPTEAWLRKGPHEDAFLILGMSKMYEDGPIHKMDAIERIGQRLLSDLLRTLHGTDEVLVLK